MPKESLLERCGLRDDQIAEFPKVMFVIRLPREAYEWAVTKTDSDCWVTNSPDGPEFIELRCKTLESAAWMRARFTAWPGIMDDKESVDVN